ncbi:sodium:calcium antiporter, partial [Patescibacteria group bacterium]|nr:sodium:calcium antiporter [Patescibacteria group bacterium]
MSELIKEIIVFAASLFFLVKAADYFVEYSEKLGLSLKVPQFIIGVTIVSIGTSLPELVTSIFSVLEGETTMVAGNVIGSNIANILLVVGISTIIARKIEIQKSIIRLDLPLLVGSGAILILTMKDGVFTLPEAILSIVGFLIYLLYNVTEHKSSLVEQEVKRIETLEEEQKPKFKWTYPVWIVLSAIGLFISGKFTVSSVIA